METKGYETNRRAGKSKVSRGNCSLKSHIVSINVEKILLTTFFILFSLLVATQIVLTITGLKEGLNTNSAIEGMPLEKEEFLYKEGEIVLELLSEYKSQGYNIKVLVNGEESGDFSYGQLSLKVKDGDIVEIDSTKVNYSINLKINSKSSNIVVDDLNRRYTVNTEVIKIIKVKIL